MSETSAAVGDDENCPVCLDVFKEPLTLGCKHRFCSRCLQQHWDQAEARTCPVCRRRSSKEIVFVNFCPTETDIASEREPGGCSADPLQKELQALLKHRAEAQSLEQLYKHVQLHSEAQALRCEAHIKEEFSRFHQFLQQEEQLRLKALREEQSRQAQAVGPELGRIRETLASVEQSIQELQTHLQRAPEDLTSSKEPAQTRAPQPLPQPGPGLLLNQNKLQGNLAFRVWKKMGGIVQYSPVVLDPNSADPCLSLSEDLTRVRYLGPPLVSSPPVSPPLVAPPPVSPPLVAPPPVSPPLVAPPPVLLPENPERFGSGLVLGSKGWRSGTHQWDVEVGDHPLWAVGVAKESAPRKGLQQLTPERGFWGLGFNNDGYHTFTTTLDVKQRPETIHVQLDYAAGTVSFYDPKDKALIHRHTDTFTERLFPFICVGCTDEDCRTHELYICRSEGQVLCGTT